MAERAQPNLWMGCSLHKHGGMRLIMRRTLKGRRPRSSRRLWFPARPGGTAAPLGKALGYPGARRRLPAARPFLKRARGVPNLGPFHHVQPAPLADWNAKRRHRPQGLVSGKPVVSAAGRAGGKGQASLPQSFRLWRAMDRSFGTLKHTV
jgi:hypothetical protein